MLTRGASKLFGLPAKPMKEVLLHRLRPAEWELVALASLCAGIGSGWRVLLLQADLHSPLTTALTTILAIFCGWYVWGFFLYLTDNVLFGSPIGYRETLRVFGRAYIFQALFVLTFTRPLGWVWGWIALYLTVAVWAIVGPRQHGTRTWQAVLAATVGMLVWLACLLALTLMLSREGVYIAIGIFLA
jgi:hypothetical protein